MVFYTYIGLRPHDWEWHSRCLAIHGGKVSSEVRIQNKKRGSIECYYFDHNEFFQVSNSDFVLRLSIAATRSLNQRFAPKEKPAPPSAEPPCSAREATRIPEGVVDPSFFFLKLKGEQKGPYTEDQVRSMW